MTARLSRFLVAIVAPGALYAVACGSGGGKPDGSIVVHDGSGSDAGLGTDAAIVCTASASYGSAAPTMQVARTFLNGSSAHFEIYQGNLNADPDGLQIELYAGAGGFGAGDVRAGTYTWTGSDADGNYATCGICVRLFTNLTMSGSNLLFTDQYFASSGTVTLTSTSGTTFTGSFSNLTLDHVTIDPNTNQSTPIDHCTATVTSGDMSATLMIGSAAFTGSPDAGALRHRHR